MRLPAVRLLVALCCAGFATVAAALPDPRLYLPTLQFDGKDWLDSGEKNFPQAFDYRPYDSFLESNKEYLVRFKIGSNVSGTGSTGLAVAGPNDQRPALYFHQLYYGGYDIYQYWLYYADNDSSDDHEHDWERYFVYFRNGTPTHVLLSSDESHKFVSWYLMPKDNGRPKIGVNGGSHHLKTASEDGVKIRYDGTVSKNNGRLDQGAGQVMPWVVYSNDVFPGAIAHSVETQYFYYGDPAYNSDPGEYDRPMLAPWYRSDWSTPPLP